MYIVPYSGPRICTTSFTHPLGPGVLLLMHVKFGWGADLLRTSISTIYMCFYGTRVVILKTERSFKYLRNIYSLAVNFCLCMFMELVFFFKPEYA